MTRAIMLVMLVVVFSVLGVLSVHSAETYQFKAKVSDIEGRPLEGAKLFLYGSSNVRRPADFISSLSDRAGQIQIVLPSGKYWVVARHKADGKYGPLMPGDKHSGEPLEVDVTVSGGGGDFVVADIRELGQKKRVGSTEVLRIKGLVVDTLGMPAAKTFVFANRSKEFNELPDYVSAWTGDDGKYELFLPPGVTYYVSVSRQFPPVISEATRKPLVLEPGKIDIAMDINLTVQ